MKKLLSILMCFILVLGTVGLVGCGDTTFNGNYKALEPAEAAQFKEEIDASSGEQLDGFDGVEVELKIKGSSVEFSGFQAVELSCYYKAVKNAENKVEMSGWINFKMNYGGQDINVRADVYYRGDGYLYMKVNMAVISLKMKQEIVLEDYFLDFSKYDPIKAEGLNEIFEEFISQGEFGDAIKLYLDKGETQNKLKIELNDFVVNGGSVSGEFYYVYDVNGNVLACKMDFAGGSDNVGGSIYMTIKRYDGKINLPNDLDDYSSGLSL